MVRSADAENRFPASRGLTRSAALPCHRSLPLVSHDEDSLSGLTGLAGDGFEQVALQPRMSRGTTVPGAGRWGGQSLQRRVASKVEVHRGIRDSWPRELENGVLPRGDGLLRSLAGTLRTSSIGSGAGTEATRMRHLAGIPAPRAPRQGACLGHSPSREIRSRTTCRKQFPA